MLNKEGNRELAYLERITAIEPIVGSDNCECAMVGGWKAMVRKNTFAVGDLCVVFEYDSLLDASNPAFAFMAAKKYRIKPQRYTFGGKGNFVSDCLVMSPTDFGWDLGINAEGVAEGVITKDKKAIACGDGLTEYLNIKYWEAEDNQRKAPSIDKYKKMVQRHFKLFRNPFVRWLMRREWGKKLLFVFFGKKKDRKSGWNWTWVSKSDQERCQNMPWVFNDKETTYTETVKIDGTSSTYVLEKVKFNKWKFSVCSRNVVFNSEDAPNYHSDTENVYWEVAKKWNIEEFLKQYAEKHHVDGVALQGETAGCSLQGVTIQGDPHQFGELRFFGFDLYVKGVGKTDILDAKKECNEFGIEWVPVTNLNYTVPDSCDELLSHATGDCEAPGAHGLREGYVYRKNGDPKMSFKAVSNEYLLGKK